MGVKDLWSILSPICEKRSLWELQNKTIAIDLSAWICDSQSLSRLPQVNMYLRNLFFRTSYLLLLGVKPVFILEGKAPELKVKTILNRQKKSSKHCNGNDVKKTVHRPRLKSLQKQCAELLSYMGLSCIEAPGEAEAFCAHLNQQGLVDGVISQDSDAFLYGAREVYRNFQMAPKYTYDAYSMNTIEKTLKLSRTKLIGFSILSGSDYNSGVFNIGKETAIKFLTSVPDEYLFQRFSEWKQDSSNFSNQQTYTLTKEMEIEMIIKEKALLDKNFPDFDVIAEFTAEPGPLHLEYTWKKPDLNKFIILADKKLMWDEEYATKKMVPLFGRWLLENRDAGDGSVKIIKIESAFGKNSHYKVTWNLFDIVTTERKDLVQKAYPELVTDYEGLRIAKIKNPQKRRRKNMDDVEYNVLPPEKVTAKTSDYLISHRPNVKESILKDIVSDDSNYLNLSGIIEDIVTRPNSNPAVTQLSKLL